MTSITELGAASSSETVFLAESHSYRDDLVCVVKFLMPWFYTVAVLQTAYPDLPVALKSGYRGHCSLPGDCWGGTAQNILSLTYIFVWKGLQSVSLIKFSVISSRNILVTHGTALLLYNVLQQKVQS